jgi:hypothetical protein
MKRILPLALAVCLLNSFAALAQRPGASENEPHGRQPRPGRTIFMRQAVKNVEYIELALVLFLSPGE